MAGIDRIVDFMRTHDCDSLLVESDQECIVRHADGTSQHTRDKLTGPQIRELVEQVLPERYKAAFARQAPFTFEHSASAGMLAVTVEQNGAEIRLRVELTRQPLLVPAAAVAAQEFAEPLPPPEPLAAYDAAIQPEPPPYQAKAHQVAPAPQSAWAPSSVQAVEAALLTPEATVSGGVWPSVPATLLKSDLQLRRFAVTAGCVLGAATSVALAVAAPDGSMLAKVFDWHSLGSLIPVAISCLFFWGMIICWQRFSRLQALQTLSSRALVDQMTRALSAGVPAASAQLAGPVVQASPVLRRLQAVLRQWQAKPGLQEADVILQQHSSSDGEELHSGYSLVRTFVWALPVLGLIGTVIGISLAVGGFAKFLGGAIDDVDLIKKNLVSVTGGLSFAFLITLHGLMTSLILMLASSSLQTREQKLYADVEQAVADMFLPELQRLAPAQTPQAAAADPRAWRESMEQAAGQVLQSAERLSRQLAESTSSKMLELAGAQAKLLSQPGEQFMGAIAEQTRMIGANAEALAGLARATQAAAESQQTFQGVLQAFAAANVPAAFDRFSDALAGQSRDLQATSAAVAQLSAATQEIASVQTRLQQATTELKQADLPAAFDRLTAALAAQSRDLQEAASRVASLCEGIHDIGETHSALHEATVKLHETGLSQSLSDLRHSLTTLGPVLASFRQPFVLQAVPVAPDGNGRRTEGREAAPA